MTDSDFWHLVSLLDWDKTGDDEAVVAPLVGALAMRSVDDIQAFEDVLAEKLFALDAERFARNIGAGAYVDESTFFSVDNFLYSRCVVVANGASYFDSVLKDPRVMPRDLEFEPILYVAAKAYRKKTGEDFTYVSKVDYETFSNEAGWR